MSTIKVIVPVTRGNELLRQEIREVDADLFNRKMRQPAEKRGRAWQGVKPMDSSQDPVPVIDMTTGNKPELVKPEPETKAKPQKTKPTGPLDNLIETAE